MDFMVPPGAAVMKLSSKPASRLPSPVSLASRKLGAWKVPPSSIVPFCGKMTLTSPSMPEE